MAEVPPEQIRAMNEWMTARAGGAVTNPSGTERLHQYWVHGAGAAKIRWGEPGDFDRCVMHISKFIHDAKGYCNLAHHAALGMYPAQHAAMEKKATGRSAVPTTTEENRPAESGRAASLAPFRRSFPLTDVSVRSGDRDGKIVTAYAAVFDTPTEIHDQDGDYYEVIDRSAFNKAIADARPAGIRTHWQIGVFYNHGMTILGTPSEQGSMPVGVPLDLKADGTGLLTVTQYHRSQFCEDIIEGLESGAIPGYSFSGMFRRSDPLIPRGGLRRGKDGSMRTVRRTESTLREYGPTPFPAYKEAAVLGMRAETLLASMAADPELAQRMLSMLSGGTPGEQPAESGTLPDGEQSPRSRVTHSGRSVKEDMQAARSAFLQRHRR